MNKIILLALMAAMLVIKLLTYGNDNKISNSELLPKTDLLLSSSKPSPEKEKDAIRKVISGETETYYRQDFEGWKKHFVNKEYFRQYGYWEGYEDKVRYFNGFDTLQKVKHKQFLENKTYWKGSYEKRYNENFRIYPDVAWYSFEQDSFDGKTNKFLGRSLEIRILEKHDGFWKIAFLGYHYLPVQKQNK